MYCIGVHTLPCWMAWKRHLVKGWYQTIVSVSVDVIMCTYSAMCCMMCLSRMTSMSLFLEDKPYPFIVGEHQQLVQYLVSVHPLKDFRPAAPHRTVWRVEVAEQQWVVFLLLASCCMYLVLFL